MKFKKTLALISILSLFVLACAKTDKKAVPAGSPNFQSQKEALEHFEAANALFDSEDYAAAAKSYDKIMLERPVSTLDGLIMFNSGLAHFYLEKCDIAVERFRRVIRFSRQKKAKALELRAKLRLSDAYACTGDSRKSMVLLVEVFKDRQQLNPAIGLAEVPAKLAAGYSRIGNRKMAEHYFQVADRGLKMIENSAGDKKDRDKLLAKTLFTMGDTSKVKFDSKNHKGYFRTLKTLQKYLLRSISYDIEPWASKGVSQILAAYDYTWQFVDIVEAPEEFNKVRGGRYVKKQRGSIVQAALENIVELEGEKLPTEKGPKVSELFSQLDRQKLKFRNYLVAEVPGSELTEAARKLLKPRREGKVKTDEESVLEKKKRLK